MKLKTAYFPLALALVLAAGILLGRLLPMAKDYDKLDEVVDLIRMNYVDDIDKEVNQNVPTFTVDELNQMKEAFNLVKKWVKKYSDLKEN